MHPRDALELHESVAAKPTPLRDDGTVLIHIIRPGAGEGRGNHFYPADMLQENAHKFSGWKVYMDHQSAQAKQALGGLPRPMRDLGGLVESSWWDASVPANDRHDAGAVVGQLRPIRELREIIEEAPELAEFSIRAKATDVHPNRHNGSEVWVVEGIRNTPPGSVDAVTEGGAGGRVAEMIEGIDREYALAEARAIDEETETIREAAASAETSSDSRTAAVKKAYKIARKKHGSVPHDVQQAIMKDPEAYCRANGGDMEEAKLSQKERDALPDSAFAGPDRTYPIHDENHARAALTQVAKHGDAKLQESVRSKVKKRYAHIDVQESTNDDGPHAGIEGGDSVMELEEALRDPESPVARAVNDLVESRVDDRLEEAKTDFEAEAEKIRNEAEAKADRRIALRDMRDEATSLIEEAKLPEKHAAKLRKEYSLAESTDGDTPSAKLDIFDEADGDGKVTKAALDGLRESVKADIAETRELIAEVNPTKVEGQGAGSTDDGAEIQEGKTEKPYWQEHLQEAGFDEPDKIYARS